MPLSPREERILAAIEDGLGTQDPRLAAALARPHHARFRRLRPPLGAAQAAALVAVLAVLVLVHAADLIPGLWGTASITLALLVPWTAWATRCAGRATRSPTDPTEDNPS